MTIFMVEFSWNVMAHGDAREGMWRENWRKELVASTLHATSEHDLSNITTADAHTSASSSRLNWCPRRFKWTCPFRRKTNSGFCVCAITFQTQSTCGTIWCSIYTRGFSAWLPCHVVEQANILDWNKFLCRFFVSCVIPQYSNMRQGLWTRYVWNMLKYGDSK
jgi:hypothetical protein